MSATTGNNSATANAANASGVANSAATPNGATPNDTNANGTTPNVADTNGGTPLFAYPDSNAICESNVGSSRSELTLDDFDMVLDSPLLSASVPANPPYRRGEQILSDNLAQLRAEIETFIGAFGAARSAGNETAADEALRKIERTRKAITSLEGCSKIFEPTSKHTESSRNDNGLGLTLNRRDLPKFQLATSVFKSFPNEEVFESVEHFLRTFEIVIESSSLKIEKVWRKFLPLCLPHSDDGWVETNLKKCTDWTKARACFKERHGSSLVTRRYTDQVFTMTMKNTESIGDYSKRFLQAVYNAGLPKTDARIADRFLASLTLPVQTLIRVTMARSGPNGESRHEWTVELITQIGRDILGDDNRLYSEATRLIPGAQAHTEKRREDNPIKKQSHINKYKISKPDHQYYCKHHGKNRTHDTKDCYFLKKRGGDNSTHTTNGRIPCRHCGEPYYAGHSCNKKGSVLAVSKKKESKPKESTVEQVITDIDSDMEDIHFDCKYQNKEIQKRIEANDSFNLLTPIIIENQKLIGMVDTGSSCTIIDFNCLKNKLKINKINKSNGSYNFLTKTSGTLQCGHTDPLTIKYTNGISFKHALEVLEFNNEFKFDILLGRDILPKLNIGLTGVAFRFENDYTHSDNTIDSDMIYKNLNIDTEQKFEPDNSPAGTPEQRAEFMNTIKSSLEANKNIPMSSSCPLPESIVYLPTERGMTAYRRQYPIPHALRPVLDKQVKEWLETGTIKKSKTNTSFNHPLLLVPKRNKSGDIIDHRVCLDVRLLNQILPPAFSYPIPKVQTIFNNLSGKKYFTVIDGSQAYHRFKINPDDSHKLTFTHLDGQQYSFIKACFGLKFLTSQYQFVMATLFEGVDCVQNFVDDCIVASETFEQHVQDVKRVVDIMTSANLIINPDKCVWFQHSVRLLGFTVNKTGTKVDKRKLTNVDNWPIPKSAKQVQQFMGLINYFRDYIPMISKVAEPISRLSHANNVEALWGNEQTKSFNALKDILHQDLILHYADMSKPFYVATDASQYGVSFLLYQRDDQGRDKYISFGSTSLSPSQRKWSTTRRELYALVLALKKFRPFLWGTPFIAYVDHKALTYAHTQKNLNPMLMNWIETILDFDMTICHVPGIENKLPDILSRLYPPDDGQNLVEDRRVIKKTRNNLKHKNRVMMRKKKFSKDRVLNVLTTQLVNNKDDISDYMTPPDSERNGLLYEAHSFGHFGSHAIVNELHSQGLHWSNIYEEAKNIVKSCKECQRHNISKKGFHNLTSVVAFKPFERIAIDLAGPFPVTSEGNTMLLVVTDVCSKFIILRAMPNKNSDTVAKELVKIFGDFGMPMIMQSDNGTEFRNSLLANISKALGIERRYSTPYHPRGNGAAEASVKIAVNTLRKMMKSNSHDWCHYLPIVQLCINRHIPYKTQTSPFSLMFARRIVMPDDKEKETLPKDTMTIEELEKQIEYMEDIVFPAIHERAKRINEEYQKKFNKKNILVDIPKGTHVMVRLKQRANKLAPLYEGPYTVVRKNRGNSYELKDELGELLHRNYVPSELKIVTIDESAIEDELYEVEDIRDHRGQPGEREYLVKWAGYGERANTWQKADDFTDPNIIQKYWRKLKN
jgi:hypothetical protein